MALMLTVTVLKIITTVVTICSISITDDKSAAAIVINNLQ